MKIRKLSQWVLILGLASCLGGCAGGAGSVGGAGATAVGTPGAPAVAGHAQDSEPRLQSLSAVTAKPQPSPSKVGASPTPSPTASTVMVVPSSYTQLYDAIAPLVGQFSSTVDSEYPNVGHKTDACIWLDHATGTAILEPLAGATQAEIKAAAQRAIADAAQYQRQLGVGGVTIEVDYPLLVQHAVNLPNQTSGWTTANFNNYLSYYEQVVDGVRALGMHVDVETNTVLVKDLPPAGPAYSYAGITMQTLEAGQIENIQNVIDNLKPDRLIIASEPGTIAGNTGLTAISQASGYAEYVYTLRNGVNHAASPNTKFGASCSDWQSSKIFSTLLASTSLDFYDLHLYPPDGLVNAISDLHMLAQTNKPVTISENFLNKEELSVDGTSGPIPHDELVLRNAWSFWAPLDVEYLGALLRLCNGLGISSVSFNFPREFFAYVPYNSTTAAYTYQEMNQELDALQLQSRANGTVSPLGAALRAYTSQP